MELNPRSVGPQPARPVRDLAAIAAKLGHRHTFFQTQLQVLTKEGELVPFELNRAQQYVDQKLDEQLQRQGKVRALILKGRQQGMSTYIGGRYYHRVTIGGNVFCFIIAHDTFTTNKLFNIAKRFYDRAQERELRPVRGHSNPRAMNFPFRDSGYEVGTAGSPDIGRGGTVQLLHGSEVAFWQKGEEIAAGAQQQVPDANGTEIILESTANGIGGYFYEMWTEAEAGKNEYIAIFVPWYWQEEYRTPVPPDFAMEPEEMELADLYGLSPDQVYWRRLKIASLRSEWRFKQEYPFNAQEAFQMSGANVLISGDTVMRARKEDFEEDDDAALVMGVDCAWSKTGDRTKLISRQGRVLGKKIDVALQTDDTMEIVGVIGDAIDTFGVRMTFIDLGGAGKGIYDRLVELGRGDRVTGVNFGGKAHDPITYFNKRAEMYGLLNDWLEDIGGADIPDNDLIHRHLCSSLCSVDSRSRSKLEAKPKIKKEFGFSPDEADASALTFAETVVRARSSRQTKRRRRKRKHTSWMSN